MFGYGVLLFLIYFVIGLALLLFTLFSPIKKKSVFFSLAIGNILWSFLILIVGYFDIIPLLIFMTVSPISVYFVIGTFSYFSKIKKCSLKISATFISATDGMRLLSSSTLYLRNLIFDYYYQQKHYERITSSQSFSGPYIERHFKKNNSYEIYICPQDPTIFILQRKWLRGEYVFYVLISLFLAALSLFFLFRSIIAIIG